MYKNVVLAMLAMTIIVSAVSAGSVISMSATGLISTASDTIDTGCNSLNAFGTSTFGVADINYVSTETLVGTSRSITSLGGKLTALDSMLSMAYSNPVQNCTTGMCKQEGGFYNIVTANSEVTLVGPGYVSVMSGVNAFGVDAAGTGRMSYSTGVLDMTGTTDNSKCITEFRQSERINVVGKFNLSSRFTYTR